MIISLPADDTLQQRIQHSTRGEQIIKRPQRPGRWRLGRGLQVSPGGREQQTAAVRQLDDQLQPSMAAHPPGQLKRAALPRVSRPQHPNRRWEAIEVGLVSCLPLTAFRGIWS
jgi:hypothetical protein